jgi:hypothetical protein
VNSSRALKAGLPCYFIFQHLIAVPNMQTNISLKEHFTPMEILMFSSFGLISAKAQKHKK